MCVKQEDKSSRENTAVYSLQTLINRSHVGPTKAKAGLAPKLNNSQTIGDHVSQDSSCLTYNTHTSRSEAVRLVVLRVASPHSSSAPEIVQGYSCWRSAQCESGNVRDKTLIIGVTKLKEPAHQYSTFTRTNFHTRLHAHPRHHRSLIKVCASEVCRCSSSSRTNSFGTACPSHRTLIPSDQDQTRPEGSRQIAVSLLILQIKADVLILVVILVVEICRSIPIFVKVEREEVVLR